MAGHMLQQPVGSGGTYCGPLRWGRLGVFTDSAQAWLASVRWNLGSEGAQAVSGQGFPGGGAGAHENF